MEKVISRSEEVFDGRNLLIKNGKSFTGRPAQKIQRYQTITTTNAPENIAEASGKAGGRVAEGKKETTVEKSEVRLSKKEGKLKYSKFHKTRTE